MATPLSTRSIVWAKWRGAYRRVFSLAVLPAIVTAIGLNREHRFVGVSMVLGLILAYGAAITSLGLALATWVRRMGRAVALSVGIYALVTVGGFFLCFVGLVPNNIEAECAIGQPVLRPGLPARRLGRSPILHRDPSLPSAGPSFTAASRSDPPPLDLGDFRPMHGTVPKWTFGVGPTTRAKRTSPEGRAFLRQRPGRRHHGGRSVGRRDRSGSSDRRDGKESSRV